MLRIEVRLKNKAGIGRYTNEVSTSKQIRDIFGRSREIFRDTLVKVIPEGDFLKKDKAIAIIEDEVGNKALRAKMVRLVELIPEKKSLQLAQKALKDRTLKKTMEKFAEIGISPITLSKRQEVKKLKSLYEWLD